MTLDARMRADLSLPDPATPDVTDALRAVRAGVTKRRRTHRLAGVAAAIVVAVVGVAAVVQVSGDDGTKIQSRPAADAASPVLVPTHLPDGLTAVGVESPSSGSGSTGSGPPFTFTRTYALYNADRTQVERSFQIDVGVGDTNSDPYRTGWVETQVRGFPAKLSAAGGQTTLVWIDDAGRIFRIGGDMSTVEAFDVANGLVIDPNGAMEPQTVKAGTLPPGFVHLVDFMNPRPTSFAGRHVLFYATPSGDATLTIEMDTQPTETVAERLLVAGARVIDVRAHRGVFVDRPGSGRELRWLEPPNTLVTMSATSLTEAQLKDIAEGLQVVTDTEWDQLRRDVGPPRVQANTRTNPPRTLAPLAAIGPAVVAATGNINGSEWKLVVYEVAPAAGQTERRFCYELRGHQSAPQSCFPLRPEGLGVKWLYAEGHLGRWFILGAAPHDARTELGDNNGEAVPLQLFDDPSLPMQVFVAPLPDPYRGSLSIRNQEWSSVQLAGPIPDGSRRPFSTPALPGVYPEFASGLFATPPPAPFQSPNVKPEPSPFCTAIEDFRTAGVTDESAKLPYFERMRAAAPSDSQPPLDTIIEWLRQGTPQPKPAEVTNAEFQSTLDWIRHCQS